MSRMSSLGWSLVIALACSNALSAPLIAEDGAKEPAKQAPADRYPDLVVGKPFPALSGTTVDGKKVSLADYKGKVVLVDFWATWCGPCRGELPNVKDAYTKFHDKGFEVLAISLDQDATKLKAFVAKEELPWPQVFDGNGWKNAVAQQFKVHSIPAAFLINKDGTLASKQVRGPALEPAVVKALAAK